MTQQRFKPFFVHQQTNPAAARCPGQSRRPRAFTAFVQPADNPREVLVQVAFCSQKDDFVKAVGRTEALAKPTTTINARNLPEWLQEQALKLPYGFRPYTYILKYVV